MSTGWVPAVAMFTVSYEAEKQNYKQEDESLARLWDDREMVSCILLANILI